MKIEIHTPHNKGTMMRADRVFDTNGGRVTVHSRHAGECNASCLAGNICRPRTCGKRNCGGMSSRLLGYYGPIVEQYARGAPHVLFVDLECHVFRFHPSTDVWISPKIFPERSTICCTWSASATIHVAIETIHCHLTAARIEAMTTQMRIFSLRSDHSCHRSTAMKTIRCPADLRPYGFDCLTGEACGFEDCFPHSTHVVLHPSDPKHIGHFEPMGSDHGSVCAPSAVFAARLATIKSRGLFVAPIILVETCV